MLRAGTVPTDSSSPSAWKALSEDMISAIQSLGLQLTPISTYVRVAPLHSEPVTQGSTLKSTATKEDRISPRAVEEAENLEKRTTLQVKVGDTKHRVRSSPNNAESVDRASSDALASTHADLQAAKPGEMSTQDLEPELSVLASLPGTPLDDTSLRSISPMTSSAPSKYKIVSRTGSFGHSTPNKSEKGVSNAVQDQYATSHGPWIWSEPHRNYYRYSLDALGRSTEKNTPRCATDCRRPVDLCLGRCLRLRS